MSDLEIPPRADCHLWPVGKGKCLWRATRPLGGADAYEDLRKTSLGNTVLLPAHTNASNGIAKSTG